MVTSEMIMIRQLSALQNLKLNKKWLTLLDQPAAQTMMEKKEENIRKDYGKKNEDCHV